MTDPNEFRQSAHALVDWIADYLENIENYPVKSRVRPGEIKAGLPVDPPLAGEPFEKVMEDFEQVLLPGVTHWQSPKFHAYFPGNSSYPSLLGEILTAAIGAQCMIWETSPAAAELEERVLDWLKKAMGLPENFKGVIQDTASTATLVALLTARELAAGFKINEQGFQKNPYRVYCSGETHSSIEKAVKIAGIGQLNLVKVPTDDQLRLDPDGLDRLILEDLQNGLEPLCLVATLGTTGTCAIDPLKVIAEIASRYGIWLHVDAAYAGTALLLDEYKWMIEGIEQVDSFVFNPHKWMFTNFDCTAYYVKDEQALIKTFEVLPEYLKTETRGKVNDYRDWGIPLGRRFRALKLWFVIKSFGLQGIRDKLRDHIQLAENFERWVNESDRFEIMIKRSLNLVCFRFRPPGINSDDQVNDLNRRLIDELNASGKIYLTHTTIDQKYALRIVIGQTNVRERHLVEDWQLIREKAAEIYD